MRSGTGLALCWVLWTDPDEVVGGTTERVVKARTVPRKLAGQRGDIAYAKSIMSCTVATESS